MPDHKFNPKMSDIVAGESLFDIGRLTYHSSAASAFSNSRGQASASAQGAVSSQSSWISANPSTAAHRTSAPASPCVSFTGIVHAGLRCLYLCPLVAHRGSTSYSGELSAHGIDLSPIDHYQHQALEAVVGRQHIDGLEYGIRSMPVNRVAVHPVIGNSRIKGLSRTPEAESQRMLVRADDAYWDTAGHRQLARRLGFDYNICMGFAVMKNVSQAIGGVSQHQVMFVSRLNQTFSGDRGLNQEHAGIILDCLSRLCKDDGYRPPKPKILPSALRN